MSPEKLKCSSCGLEYPKEEIHSADGRYICVYCLADESEPRPDKKRVVGKYKPSRRGGG